MKKNLNRLGFLAVFALLGLFAAMAQTQTTKTTDEVQVLFIGKLADDKARPLQAIAWKAVQSREK